MVISFEELKKINTKDINKKIEEIMLFSFLRAVDEVEETATKLELGILTYEMLRNEKDSKYTNKLVRYLFLRRYLFIVLFEILEKEDIILEPENPDYEIIELIFRFRKKFCSQK